MRITFDLGVSKSLSASLILGLVLCLVIISNPLLAEVFPQDFSYSYRSEVLTDAGWLWQVNSIYHPLTCPTSESWGETGVDMGAYAWIQRYLNDYSRQLDRLHKGSGEGLGLLFVPGLGALAQVGPDVKYKQLAISPSLWTVARFRQHWYARFYVRASNVGASLSHYSGRERDIARIGMRTGEIDQSVVGYRNDWATVEFGRGREIWGPMSEDNLILAGGAPAWERLALQLNHRRFTFRYFIGFLESKYDTVDIDTLNIQRYIVGRALEYRNHDNLVLGIGEVSILAGPDRPLDFAFLNPLSTHLEVEQNKRSNVTHRNWANAVWFFHVDWRAPQNLRATGSLLLDEIQLDREDRDEGRPDAMGYLGRVAWTPMIEPVGLTLFAQAIRMNTYTLQHNYGFCNFVNRDSLLSHPIGNDADKLAIGIRQVFKWNTMVEIEYGRRRWGDNSLNDDPYRPWVEFERVEFPFGEVRTNRYLAFSVDSQPLKNLNISLEGQFDLHHSGEGSQLETWTFSLFYQLPFLWLNL